MSKRSHKRAQTQKSVVTDNERPKGLNAAVAKIKIEVVEH